MADFSVNNSGCKVSIGPDGLPIVLGKDRKYCSDGGASATLDAIFAKARLEAAQKPVISTGPSQNVQPAPKKDLQSAINPNGNNPEDYSGAFLTVKDLRKEVAKSAPADASDTPVAKRPKLPKVLEKLSRGESVHPKKTAEPETPKETVADKPAEKPPVAEPKTSPKGKVTVQEEPPAQPAVTRPAADKPVDKIEISTGPSQNVMPAPSKKAAPAEDYKGPFKSDLTPKPTPEKPAENVPVTSSKVNPKFANLAKGEPAHLEPEKPKAPVVAETPTLTSKPEPTSEAKAPEAEIKISTGPSQNVMPALSQKAAPAEDYKGPFKSDLIPKYKAPEAEKPSASAPYVRPAFAKLAKGEAAHLEPEKPKAPIVAETPTPTPEPKVSVADTAPKAPEVPPQPTAEELAAQSQAASKAAAENAGKAISDASAKAQTEAQAKAQGQKPNGGISEGDARSAAGKSADKTPDPYTGPVFTSGATVESEPTPTPAATPQAPAQPAVAPKAKPTGVMDNSIMGQLGGTEGQLLDGATGSTTDTAALVNGQLKKGTTGAHDSSKDLEGRAVAPQAPVVTSGTPKPVVEKPATPTPAPVVEKPATPAPSAEAKTPAVDPQQAADDAAEAEKRRKYQADLDAAEARQAELAKADAARITAARAETERLRLEAQAAKDAQAAKNAPPVEVAAPSTPAPKAEDPFKDDPNYLVRGKARYAKLNIPSAGEDRVYSNLDKPGFMIEHDVKLFGLKLWTSRSNYDVNEMPNLELYEPEKARTDYKYNGTK